MKCIIKSFYIWCFDIGEQATNWSMTCITCSLMTCYRRKFTVPWYCFGIFICLWTRITCECLEVSISIDINSWLKITFIKWRVCTVNYAFTCELFSVDRSILKRTRITAIKVNVIFYTILFTWKNFFIFFISIYFI